jgi:hypothetical protein
MTLINSTVSGNRAVSDGGGIHNGGGAVCPGATMDLINTTVAGGNNADGAGGGIFNNGGAVRLKNTIVADNTAGSDANCSGTVDISQGRNLSNDATCGTGAGIVQAASGLGPLANNGGPTLTHLPGPGSPAIDGVTAPATCTVGNDQRDFNRVQGAACEIGAVEVEVTSLQVVKTLQGPKIGTAWVTQQFNINVNCTPNGPNTPVTVTLTQGGSQTVPNILVGSSCTITETPPLLPTGYPPSCTWQTTLQIDGALPPGLAPPGVLPPGGYTFANIPALPNPHVVEVINTITCPNGQLTVHKVITNAAPPPAGVTFGVNANCTNGFNQTQTMPPTPWVLSPMPYGTSCLITEPTATPFTNAQGANCFWLKDASQIQTVIITSPNQSVTVTNTYACTPPPTTLLNVQKIIEYPAGMFAGMSPAQVLTLVSQFQALSFNVDVICSLPGAIPPTVTITAAQGAPVTNITAGSDCAITEKTPLPSLASVPAPYSSCTWGTPQLSFNNNQPVANGSSISNLQQTQGGNNVAVINKLNCPTGSALQITKQVVNTLGGPTPAIFDMSFNCTPSGPSAAQVPVPAGPVGWTFLGIAPNSSCTVTEAPLPSIPNFNGCPMIGGPVPLFGSASWVTTYAPSQTVTLAANTTTTVTVTNTLVCDPPLVTGSLTVFKTMIHDGLQATGGTYDVKVDCTAPGPTTTLTLTGPSLQQVLPGIPVNSVCTINEIPAPPSLPFTCGWITTYPMGSQVTIQQGNQTLQVHNVDILCGLVPNAPNLIVTKDLRVSGPSGLETTQPLGGMSFNVTLTCTPSTIPSTQNLNLNSSNQYTFNTASIAQNDTCTITETPLPTVPASYANRSCQWDTTYWNKDPLGEGLATPAVSGSSVAIKYPAGKYFLTVRNTLVCLLPIVRPPGDKPAQPPAAGDPPAPPSGCPPGTVRRDGKCVRQPVCNAPFVLNAAGNTCVCPAGTTFRNRTCVKVPECRPPMVLNQAGSACVCPTGTQRRGNECVGPTVCKPPMFYDKRTNACACPQGTVQKGNECVRQLVCRPPMIANRAGTACECPQGMIQRGQTCVRDPRQDKDKGKGRGEGEQKGGGQRDGQPGR